MKLGAASLALGIALGIALASCASADVSPLEPPPAMPGPFHAGRAAELARVGPGDATALEGTCEGCHEEIAAEHRTSLHHAATTDAAYRKALAVEPLPFCRGCHAPEADPKAEASPALAAIGVGCVSCHVTDRGILAAPRDVHDAPPAPHAVVRDARFATDGGCAGCHEFDFPPPVRGAQMQRTVTEHRASKEAGTSCGTCHLPRVEGARGQHRSHAFVASRSPDFVRQAVRVAIVRSGPTSARVTLEPGRVGHAFPTGDLFRRVTVDAEAIGDDYAVLARADVHLARHFGFAPGVASRVRTELRDDRVAAGARTADLDLGPAATGAALHVVVRYERVAHPTSRDGEDAIVEGAIDLGEATLP